MRNLCIIPARGGSKRIPRKNIRDFQGKPIIAYTIEIAQKSNLFDYIFVSTDDREIADISEQYGAKVPFLRSKQASNDFATTLDVLQEAVSDLSERREFFDNLCCIYATAPLMQEVDLKKGYDLLCTGKYDSVFSIGEFDYPIWRALEMNQNSQLKPIWESNMLKRSQDLQAAYHDAGQWYWINVEYIKNGVPLISEKSGGVLLDSFRVQDIDTESDWKIAELKYEIIQNTK